MIAVIVTSFFGVPISYGERCEETSLRGIPRTMFGSLIVPSIGVWIVFWSGRGDYRSAKRRVKSIPPIEATCASWLPVMCGAWKAPAEGIVSEFMLMEWLRMGLVFCLRGVSPRPAPDLYPMLGYSWAEPLG